MKATIVRPDGTRIEVEGTPEEIAKLAPAPVLPATAVCVCYQAGFTAYWCPTHGYVWRPAPWPGVIYGHVGNACAAAVPNMGKTWVGTIHAGAAVPLNVPALRPSAAAVDATGWLT